jgi:serine/threonine-protein kinase
MQYVPGRSLQTRVDEDGPLGVDQILRIGVQAAAGLAAAHRQGLVHRDVKPSNILLEDTVERAVLTDFGLARAMDDASLTQTGIVAGTPHYMSPERASGGPIDHRSDLFSLGSVLYFMATGHPPFRATGSLAVLNRICREPHRPVWESHPEFPDELCDVIDRLLEKKPGRRFASADEVSQTLAELLSCAQQKGFARRRLRFARTLQRKSAAVAAAVIVFVAALVMAIWPAGEEPRSANADDAAAVAEAEPAPRPLAPAELALYQAHESSREAFAAELAAAQEAAAGAGRDSEFLQFGDVVWTREIQEIDSRLKELEGERVLSK